jgi:hypothetical protein
MTRSGPAISGELPLAVLLAACGRLVRKSPNHFKE